MSALILITTLGATPLLPALFVPSAPSTIDRVVLMPDRAEVVRRQTVPCRNGTADLIFEPLPAALDARTLRAQAGGQTEVLGIRHESKRTERAVGDDAEAIRKQRVAADEQAVRLQMRQEALSARNERIEGLTQLFVTTVGEQLRDGLGGSTQWTRSLERLRKQRMAVATERRALEADQRRLARHRDKLDRQWARLSKGSRQYVRATVSVSCRGRQAEANLAYIVPQARWRPEYDIDFEPKSKRKGQARLTVSAIVEQSTGEDWNDVTLVLSTAQPKLGATAPYPASIRIGGQEREAEKVLVESYEDRRSVKAGGAGATREPTTARLDDGGNTVTLTLPAKVTVRADGQQHWFPVDESRTTATQAYVAFPRVKRGVYRVVRFENPAGYPLLAGRINSFVQRAYVGSAPLAFAGAGAPIEVSLGIEPGLAVDRVTRTDKEAVKGFLSKSKHIARAYRTTIANRTGRPFEVEVREQVPITQNEEIEVRMLADGTTPAYRLDKDRGLVSWKVKVGAKKNQRVDIAFEIELPDDWKMNR